MSGTNSFKSRSLACFSNSSNLKTESDTTKKVYTILIERENCYAINLMLFCCILSHFQVMEVSKKKKGLIPLQQQRSTAEE